MFIGTPLISEEQIQKKVKALAHKISSDYKNKDLVVYWYSERFIYVFF